MRLSDNRRDLNERMFDYAPNVTLMDVTDVLKEANVFQDAGKVVSVQLAIQSSVERRSRRSNQYFVALRAVDDYGNKRQETRFDCFDVCTSIHEVLCIPLHTVKQCIQNTNSQVTLFPFVPDL